jgi:hypothetical protein
LARQRLHLLRQRLLATAAVLRLGGQALAGTFDLALLPPGQLPKTLHDLVHRFLGALRSSTLDAFVRIAKLVELETE